ncbi:beta,beta-carotene 15,15'-dioxygenase-like [Babylonia areolata]|uniref:beta,beta-carotene 15,15'-dioxygenase-like n=1 Tax=Babylonia areolata TaxID=304850 RepID=UPI003FCFDC26
MSSQPAATKRRMQQEGTGPDDEDQQQQRRRCLPEWMTLDKDSHTKTPVATEISGKIPKWLNGNLYRNGPGVFSVGNQKLEHLFDGLALVHRFLIYDGDVSYQSRILDTDTWTRSCKANRLVSSQFATYAYPDPCKSLFDKIMSYLLPINPNDMTDNTAVNVIKHGDKLYAVTDTTVLNEVDPETLKQTATVDLHDTVAVHMATAHPHFDTDGTMYNLGTSFNPMSAYSIVAIPPKHPDTPDEDVFQKAYQLTTIPSRFKMHVSYGHSFGMSAEYFVLLEQPLALNIVKLLTMNWRREGIASNFVKFPEEEILFHVIRRSDNQRLPVSFKADPGFCFHFINCYEEEEHLVVDLCCYEDVGIVEEFFLENLADKADIPPATFRRYVLPLNVTEADPEVNLVDMADSQATAHMVSPGVIHCSPDYITEDKTVIDLPRINYEQCNGKKYRYAYGISKQGKKQKLVKVDVEKREAAYWRETGQSPGEPIFVARPGASTEDDGVVVSAVLSELPDAPSFLVVLDAKTFQELGRATIPWGVKMAMSIHGSFIPDNNTGT